MCVGRIGQFFLGGGIQSIAYRRTADIFINALVSNCLAYGQLNDGRHALIAVMNAAKQLVGKNRQADADALIQQIEAQMKW